MEFLFAIRIHYSECIPSILCILHSTRRTFSQLCRKTVSTLQENFHNFAGNFSQLWRISLTTSKKILLNWNDFSSNPKENFILLLHEAISKQPLLGIHVESNVKVWEWRSFKLFLGRDKAQNSGEFFQDEVERKAKFLAYLSTCHKIPSRTIITD